MDKKYKGLKENLERFKNDLTDEKMRLLFSIAYKQGYDQALTIHDVAEQSEQLVCESCGTPDKTIQEGRCSRCWTSDSI